MIDTGSEKIVDTHRSSQIISQVVSQVTNPKTINIKAEGQLDQHPDKEHPKIET